MAEDGGLDVCGARGEWGRILQWAEFRYKKKICKIGYSFALDLHSAPPPRRRLLGPTYSSMIAPLRCASQVPTCALHAGLPVVLSCRMDVIMDFKRFFSLSFSSPLCLSISRAVSLPSQVKSTRLDHLSLHHQYSRPILGPLLFPA